MENKILFIHHCDLQNIYELYTSHTGYNKHRNKETKSGSVHVQGVERTL